MIDYNRTDIELLMAEVLSAHQLDASEGLSDAEWQTLEKAYYGYWQSASDIHSMSIKIYPSVANKHNLACKISIDDIPSDLEGFKRIDLENSKRREVFDEFVKTLTDRYMKAAIESFFIQRNRVNLERELFQKDSFALIVQASLLKSENECHVMRQLTEQPAKDFIRNLNDTTPITKALDFIAQLSNGFYVDPVDEKYFTGEKLFWGIKNEAIRKDEDASAEAIFKADLRAFLVFIIHKESFRCAERNSLEEKSDKNKDGFISESAEFSAFYQRRDADADAIIDRLVPIFQRYIKNDKFVNLIDAASEIEQLGDDAAILLTNSVLGYRFTRNGTEWIDSGIGKKALDMQLSTIIKPKEAKVSPITKYRSDIIRKTQEICKKVYPNYKTDPAFHNVMCAFSTVARLIIDSAPEDVRKTLDGLTDEIRKIGDRDGEKAAKQYVATRIENELTRKMAANGR
jgi:hypothetical protein